MSDDRPIKSDFSLIKKICNWFINNHFNIIFAIIFGVGGYLLWSNTKPQEPKSIQELINTIKDNAKTVIKDSTNVIPQKNDDFLEDYTVIKKDNIENILKAVALVSRQEAAEDYHKSFSILVAMFALFGIGFPVLVAFMQHRFNERQLDEIKETNVKANNANSDAQDAKVQANSANKDAKTALKRAFDSLDKSEKLKKDTFSIHGLLHHEVGYFYFQFSEYFENPTGYDRYNLSIILYGRSILHYIKESELAIINNINNLNLEVIRQSFNEDHKKSINELNEKIQKIKITEDIHQVVDIIRNDLNEYNNILNRIRIIAPKDLYEVIDELKKSVQNTINKINEIANKTNSIKNN